MEYLTMWRSTIVLLLASMWLNITTTTIAADWKIMMMTSQRTNKSGQMSLKNYCESWRMNVELNNIRDFSVVPSECTSYIGKYMSGTQFKVDSEATIDECTLYLNTLSCHLMTDGKDAWIFDIDDTLLSTVPYYKKHGYGGEKLNVTDLEEWMRKGKATAMDCSLRLYNDIKKRGIQIILVSSRREHLRAATIDNLVDVGYYGWKSLHLREDDDKTTVEEYKARIRSELTMKDGYRIWGILGDQWSSIKGLPTAKRTFKLPNSLYYVA